MVNTVLNSASQQVAQGLFDYLNLNRHKFNEYGQFNAMPDDVPSSRLLARDLGSDLQTSAEAGHRREDTQADRYQFHSQSVRKQ